jgi:Zn-dependent peptidase ImmA (M78 family)
VGDLTNNEMPLWRQWREIFVKVNADHVLNHFQIRNAPIPVLEIVTAAGIEVTEFGDDSEYAGVADLLGDQARIGLKKSDSESRRRFTLAHELGHIVLHQHKVRFRDAQNTPFNQEEAQANRFAAELLMPAWLVWPLPPPLRHPDSLARIFKVSAAAAEHRLRTLGGVEFGRRS